MVFTFNLSDYISFNISRKLEEKGNHKWHKNSLTTANFIPNSENKANKIT